MRKKILVVAGNYEQAQYYIRQRAYEHTIDPRQCKYICEPKDFYGYTAVDLQEVYLCGQWWLNPIYDNEYAWRQLLWLKEDVKRKNSTLITLKLRARWHRDG